MNRPLTPSLSPSDGERVAEGRVRGGSRSQCATEKSWRLSMNLKVVCLQSNDLRKPGSWPQLTSEFWRCSLSMNLRLAEGVQSNSQETPDDEATARTALSASFRAEGWPRADKAVRAPFRSPLVGFTRFKSAVASAAEGRLVNDLIGQMCYHPLDFRRPRNTSGGVLLNTPSTRSHLSPQTGRKSGPGQRTFSAAACGPERPRPHRRLPDPAVDCTQPCNSTSRRPLPRMRV